jgi:hypothetical protein
MPLPPILAAILATTNTDKSPQHKLPSLPDELPSNWKKQGKLRKDYVPVCIRKKRYAFMNKI